MMQVDSDLEKLELRLFLETVFCRYGYDFRHYAPASLKRRIKHSMGRVGVTRIADLIPLTLHDDVFFDSFLKDMSVTVTDRTAETVLAHGRSDAVAGDALDVLVKNLVQDMTRDNLRDDIRDCGNRQKHRGNIRAWPRRSLYGKCALFFKQLHVCQPDARRRRFGVAFIQG